MRSTDNVGGSKGDVDLKEMGADGAAVPARDGGLRLGGRQLAVLLHRQWLVKSRSPIGTIFEVLAPVILMSILVLGANLSTVVEYRREIYADKGIIDTNSSAWKFAKDLVELESRDLCSAVSANVTAN